MRIPLLPALCCLALAGCGSDPAPAPAQPTAEPASNTRNLRAADAVGYDGAALQRSVDRMQQKAAEQAKAADAAAADTAPADSR